MENVGLTQELKLWHQLRKSGRIQGNRTLKSVATRKNPLTKPLKITLRFFQRKTPSCRALRAKF